MLLWGQDVVEVWEAAFGEEQPATMLVGHSMGGAIAVRAAALQVPPPSFLTNLGYPHR